MPNGKILIALLREKWYNRKRKAAEGANFNR